MKVAAIICTRNRHDLIGTAVASVLANSYRNFDLYVVDQSDDDRTGSILRQLMAAHPNLHYEHSSTPGLSRAYNRGIRISQGEILAFTDDDCVVPADWIERIVGAFQSEPDAELLYGQVVRPAELVDSVDEIPTLAITSTERLNRHDGFRVIGMGANFAARRSLFDRIGLFDEVLGGGGPLKSSQDFDFQYRAYVGGATTLLRPEVSVDHYGVRTAAQWPATMRAYGIGDGAFYSKHIRCGDLFVLGLLLQRLARMTASVALHSIRNKPSHRDYLVSCIDGIRISRRYRVDRAKRLYQAT
jgi:glycosyltransferase involved in cell wall biosynthesis